MAAGLWLPVFILVVPIFSLLCLSFCYLAEESSLLKFMKESLRHVHVRQGKRQSAQTCQGFHTCQADCFVYPLIAIILISDKVVSYSETKSISATFMPGRH